MSVDRSPRVVALIATRGVVRVRVCRLCGALILAESVTQHEQVHAAQLGDGSRGDLR